MNIKHSKKLSRHKNDFVSQLEFLVDHLIKQNPYEQHNIEFIKWNEQVKINFPILYLASIYLFYYAKQKGITKFLFCTRDCCHWYKIFNKLFPDEETFYFQSSRIMLEKATKDENTKYDDYIKEIIDGSDIDKIIYVDIHGSGKRILKYFDSKYQQVPFIFILSARFHDYSEFPDISNYFWKRGKLINLVFDIRGSPIEMLNYDKIGTLVDFDKRGPIRNPLEYDLKHIKTYHKCINFIVDNIKKINIREQNIDLDELQNLLIDHFEQIKNNKPIISKFIHHIGKHKEDKKATFVNDDNFDLSQNIDISFIKILKTKSQYGLIWDGIFNGQKCIIKMVLLKEGKIIGDKNSDAKYLSSDDNQPFLHSKFIGKKSATRTSFLNEANSLFYLQKYHLSPKIHKIFIYEENPHIKYGFIVMEKLDLSLKEIVLSRKLEPNELALIKNMINKMHNIANVAHGDLKASNIGVKLNSNAKIIDCYVFDCDKVKYRTKYNKTQFNEFIEKDWRIFYNRINNPRV